VTLRRSLPVLAALLFAVSVHAQLSGALSGGPPDHDVVKMSGTMSGDRGTLTVTIENGWHMNSAKPLDDFVIPTQLTLDPSTATLLSAEYPPHVLKGFTFTNGAKLAVYEGTITIPFTATVKPGATSVRANLRYQACNDSICLPPKTVSATVTPSVSEAPGGAGGAQTKTTSTFTALSNKPKNTLPNDKLSATFAEHGLPLTLLILFVGGLALNLTPCVFPLIPITMGFFAMQSDGRRSRRFALSLSYVIGIVITYSILGVFAALSGRMFGVWLQSPAVLIGFAVLMLILASSMFGVWEFRVPQFIASRSAGRAGAAGALTMGLFVGIVAAPCVGPVVVALFTLVAAIGKPLIGMAMFATLAFGLGFPYLVALNALPKPGEWMLQVKKAMGFVLVAMAFYFLRALIGENAFRWGVAASLLVGAAFLFFSRGTRGRVMRLACASLLLIAGAAFAIPRRAGSTVDWKKYDAATIASASGKPVIIDFYADWCIPCKELDEKTFSDPGVARDLDRFVRVKADLTNDADPAVQQLTKQYGIVGVPTVVFIGADGRENPAARLTGFEPPDRFAQRLQSVR
jgi:thiol:disulfide interchange protein DsbD